MRRRLVSSILAMVLGVVSIGTSNVASAVGTTSTQQVTQTSISAAKPIKVSVNKNLVYFPDAQPYIDPVTNRTMVPVRFVSQALFAKVAWNNANKVVTLERKGTKIMLKVGEKKATVAGKTISFDANSTMKDNRTFVPLRFVSEAYGAKVEWNAKDRIVTISTKQKANDKLGQELYQAFHKSLKVSNGKLTGKLPRKSDDNLLVHFAIYFKNGKPGQVLENGESFSFDVSEIDAMGFLALDRNNGKVLSSYAYRNLPSLQALDVSDL